MTGAAGLGRARRAELALGLLAAALCLTAAGGAHGAPPKTPLGLKAEEGATVTGKLRPGETAEYTLELQVGQYFELHLNRTPREVMAYLYPPGVEPSGGQAGAYTWTELAPEVEGQVAWEVAANDGPHHLLVRSGSNAPAAYQITVAALRAATERDWARNRCLRAIEEAVALDRGGQVERSAERFDQALELCKQGEYTRGMGSSLAFRARVLQKLGRHEEAREDLEAATEVWDEVGESYSKAGSLIGWAVVERVLTHWQRAQELLDESLDLAMRHGYRDVEANGLDTYCRLHLEKGHIEKALESCRKAMAIWEELNDPVGKLDSLCNLGLIHRNMGELDIAREYFESGMDLVSRHRDLGREATLRNNLALIHRAEGDLQTALEEFQKAAEGYEAVGQLNDAAVALQNIGEIHQRLRTLDGALDYFEQARLLTERARDPMGRIQVLQSLGDLHLEREDLSEARKVLEESLELSDEADALPSRAGSLLLLGRLLLAEGHPGEARASLNEALKLSREVGNRWVEADALAALGEALAGLGDEESALELLLEGAVLGQEIGDRTGTAESHYRIARIEQRRGNLEAARRAVGEALGVVEEIRAVVGSSDLRTLFTATSRRYHEHYIDLLMAQHELESEGGHAVEALIASEEARAQSLLEVLAEADLGPSPEIPDQLLSKRREILQRISAKGLEREDLLDGKGTDPAALLAVKLELERLLTRLREVEGDIRATSPRYAALTQPRSLSLGEIRQRVLDPETVLLEYSLGQRRSFLWVVTEDEFRTYQLPARDQIDRDARCLHWLITAYGEPPPVDSLELEDGACLAQWLEPYRRAAAEVQGMRLRARQRREIEAAYSDLAARLSELLLGGPFRDGLLRFRLAIVSDGALQYLPFGALPDPRDKDQPLVWGHEVVRQPSASVLAFQRRKQPPASAPTGLVAVIADPIYSADDGRLAEIEGGSEEAMRGGSEPAPTVLQRHYPRLPFSAEEAQLIMRLAPEDRIFVALGPKATRETVLGGALSGYQYVHFATHGHLDTRFPELSSLVLSLVDEDGNPRSDGFLRLNDIYGLELDGTDMVVLSACETALGKEIRGEGLLGLTRGFQYAGAERVVSSLWQVQDLATARLMEHFYRGLLVERRPPADALRRAQLAMLDETGGASAFPYYWAGFVLQGEWR